MQHGIFELPLNLKRSHFSYAHTDDDVDRLLEANRGRGDARPRDARVSAPAVSCTIDLAAPGKQVGHLAFPKITNTGGWASTFVHDRVDRERRRPDRARAGRQPRRRVRGPGRRRCELLAGAAARSRSPGRVIVIPCLSPAASKANTRQLALRRRTSTARFPGRPDGPPNEQLAHFLSTVLFPLADVVIDMHSGGTQRLVHPVLAHARRRRRRAAQGDARGDAGVEQRLALPLHRRQRHRASCRSRPSGQGKIVDHDRARRRRPRPARRARPLRGAGSRTCSATRACSRARCETRASLGQARRRDPRRPRSAHLRRRARGRPLRDTRRAGRAGAREPVVGRIWFARHARARAGADRGAARRRRRRDPQAISGTEQGDSVFVFGLPIEASELLLSRCRPSDRSGAGVIERTARSRASASTATTASTSPARPCRSSALDAADRGRTGCVLELTDSPVAVGALALAQTAADDRARRSSSARSLDRFDVRRMAIVLRVRARR